MKRVAIYVDVPDPSELQATFSENYPNPDGENIAVYDPARPERRPPCGHGQQPARDARGDHGGLQPRRNRVGGTMRTPEQIAKELYPDYLPNGGIREAEAQEEWKRHEFDWRREATLNAYCQWVGVNEQNARLRAMFGVTDETFPHIEASALPIELPEPEFAPEGEPDIYRDHARRLAEADVDEDLGFTAAAPASV